MTYPTGNTAGVPAAYQGGGVFSPDPRYEGGGWTGYFDKGTHYDDAQLETLWIDAGGSPALAPVMAGVAGIESGGWNGDWNDTGATSLWQIEWPGSAPPGISRTQLFDPLENAKAAVRLSGDTAAGIQQNWGTDYWNAQRRGIPLAPAKSYPAAAGLTSGTSSGPGIFSGLGWNPLNWPGKIASNAAGGVLSGIEHIAVLVPILLAAGAIGVYGFVRITQPARKHAEEQLTEAGQAAAPIAMAAAL